MPFSFSSARRRHRQIWSRLTGHVAMRNFLWLVGEKCVRLVVGVLVGSWVARYLGENQFGLFAYVTAWLAIVSIIAGLGMDGLVVRDIIRSPDRAGVLIGTVISLRCLMSIATSLLVWVLISFLRENQPTILTLFLILSAGAVFQSFESAELWFQARTEMKHLVVPRLLLFLIVSGTRVWLVANECSLVVFVVVGALEMASGGIITIGWGLWTKRGFGRLSASAMLAKSLLRECWPLALSAAVVVLYMKITQLFLAEFLGDSALGVYTAAARLTEAANFLPMALASSLLPSLLRNRSLGEAEYTAARLRYFRLSAAISYCFCIPLTIGAPWIIQTLYGAQFKEASHVLVVHAWSLLPVFMGVARSQHLLNERQTKWSLRFTIWGLIVNVALSFALIPQYGAIGAAWAVVISYFISAIGTSFLFSSTRTLGKEQLVAILTPWQLSKI